MKLAAAMLLIAAAAIAQTALQQEVPAVIKFVAPAYPRTAKALRIQGTAVIQLTVKATGEVTSAIVRSSHPLFADYSKTALKQWRFKSSDCEHILEVRCVFEMTTDVCEGTDRNPLIPETQVSADLPSTVYIRTGTPCIIVETTN